MGGINKYILSLFSVLFALASSAQIAPPDENQSDVADRNRRYDSLVSRLADDPCNVQSLKELAYMDISSQNYGNILRTARKLLDIGQREDDRDARLYGLMYAGFSYVIYRQVDSTAYYLEKALELAKEADDRHALVMIYNGMGINAIESDLNYERGLMYLFEGLRYANETDDPYGAVLMGNIALNYYRRNDPAGLEYSLKMYEKGIEDDEPYHIFSGARITAHIYYMLGDYDKALLYLGEASKYLDIYRSHTNLYNLYANILSAQGRNAEAERYYLMAIRNSESEQRPPEYVIYNDYGEFLIRQGRYGEAIKWLEKGITLTVSTKTPAHRYLMYRNISDAYEAAGHDKAALRSYRIYHQESDSIFNLERERYINELRIQYETERQEREVQEKEVLLLREGKKLQLTVFLLAIIFFALLVMYVLYKRRTKVYRQIVRQQHDFLQREKRNAEIMQAAEMAEKADAGEPGDSGEPHAHDDPDSLSSSRYSVSTMSEEKSAELFRRMERLMKVEKFYTNKDLTIEKLAEELGTNRSYLSRVINENTGHSFNNYINSLRIDEAVRILSDTESEIQIKALVFELGFNNRQTFNKSFHNIIGMPATKYREELRKMYKK